MRVPKGAAVVHLIAELSGIALAQLHDSALLGGLLIAAAGAAGLHAASSPVLRTDLSGDVDALLLLEGGHATVHTDVTRRTLLLDLLVPEPAELALALEVFTRRLAPVAVTAERLVRLAASP